VSASEKKNDSFFRMILWVYVYVLSLHPHARCLFIFIVCLFANSRETIYLFVVSCFFPLSVEVKSILPLAKVYDLRYMFIFSEIERFMCGVYDDCDIISASANKLTNNNEIEYRSRSTLHRYSSYQYAHATERILLSRTMSDLIKINSASAISVNIWWCNIYASIIHIQLTKHSYV
jgi:hypothetical protein